MSLFIYMTGEFGIWGGSNSNVIRVRFGWTLTLSAKQTATTYYVVLLLDTNVFSCDIHVRIPFMTYMSYNETHMSLSRSCGHLCLFVGHVCHKRYSWLVSLREGGTVWCSGNSLEQPNQSIPHTPRVCTRHVESSESLLEHMYTRTFLESTHIF